MELFYIPKKENGVRRAVINEYTLSEIFNSELSIEYCNVKFSDLITERYQIYSKIDEEVYYNVSNYVENSSNLGPFNIEKHGNSDIEIKMFGMGLIEIEECRKEIEGAITHDSYIIEKIIDTLMLELANMNEKYKVGFSIVMYVSINNSRYIIFGRDQQGDSSLLLSVGGEGEEMLISNMKSELISLGKKPQSIEIPISGFFMFDVNNNKFFNFRWSKLKPYISDDFWNLGKLSELDSPSIKEDSDKLLNSLRNIFLSTIRERFTFIKRNDNMCIFSYIGLMFSGGLDSSLLFYLLLEWLLENKADTEEWIINSFFCDRKEDVKVYFIIELLNATFAPKEAPDRITGLSSYYEIMNIFRDRINFHRNLSIRFICVDNEGTELIRQEKHILNCVYPCNTHLDFNIGGALYFCLRGQGFLLNHNSFSGEWWKRIISKEKNDSSTWDGIFEKGIRDFSIGECSDLDFSKNQNKEKGFDETNNAEYNDKPIKKCPYCSFREHSKCQNRCCKSCCRKIQQGIIVETINPVFTACRVHKMKNSDLSSIPSTQRCIETYHYYIKESEYLRVLFKGECEESNTRPIFSFQNGKIIYRARSKYILIGSGADEFLGGYGRHITAKKHNGLTGIKNEMLFDISRLWIRNLGRDYRIALYNGRILFAPFLQRSVIITIGQLNFNNICGSKFEFTKPILRYIAKTLGMKYSSMFKKRAVQFGTRSSRQTNLKHFDSNRKASADFVYTPINY
ncbi:asparagine synthetase B like [Cryptosporidium ryanae]|uniref:asparagine synthetase B like n=1 Tax=Cryptosporidium ryanae TaxID=515981 RepID=UPI00351A17C4|nr:asparagine synthetase B like [Cryptosporidium ryanae]